MLPRFIALALVGLLMGCFSGPKPGPLLPPDISVQVHYHAGRLLSGPQAGQANQADPALLPAGLPAGLDDPAQALALRCEIYYLESMPESVLQLLPTGARLIVASQGDQPIQPSAALASGALLGWNQDGADFWQAMVAGEYGRALPLTILRGALPQGVTATFTGQSVDSIAVPGAGLVHKRVSLNLSRAGMQSSDPMEASILIQDVGAEEAGPEATPAVQLQQAFKREIIVLEERLQPKQGLLVIVLPSPFAGEENAGFAAKVSSLSETGQAGHLAALQHCLQELQQSRAAANQAIAQWSTSEDVRAKVDLSLAALHLAEHHRQALLFLGGTTGAILTEDLALSGDKDILAKLAGQISAAVEKSEAELGWVLDSSSYSLLASLLRDSELTPDLQGILLRHAGEVGRYSSAILEMVQNSKDLPHLQELLVQENRSFLEDSNPGARVRAYDWLVQRGLQPKGFDPLASAAQRRQVLRAEEVE